MTAVLRWLTVSAAIAAIVLVGFGFGGPAFALSLVSLGLCGIWLACEGRR